MTSPSTQRLAEPLPSERWPAEWHSFAHRIRVGGWKRSKFTLLALLLSLLCRPVVAAGQEQQRKEIKEVRRVLILNELGIASMAISLIDGQIRTGLESSPYQIELYSENMETTLFPDPAIQRQFQDWYIQKYKDRKPDVIVAVGPSPLKFLAQSHKRFFPGIPIVFCASTVEMANNVNLDSDFTGAWEAIEPDKTLDVALRLKPSTKHLVVVGGVAAFDRYIEAIEKESLRKYESRFDISYLTDLDMPALLEQLKRLPKDAIVLYAGISEDVAGTHYIDVTQSTPMVTSASNAPVFPTGDLEVGQGVVGGYLMSYAKEAQIAAADTMRILNGEKARDIPIVKGANVYMFDWRALQRWGFKESDLPQGSIIYNRQPTFWELYWRYVLVGLSLLLGQTFLITALLIQRKKRKESQKLLFWRLEFERLLSDLSTKFISLPANEVNMHIEAGLARIGTFLEMSRITIFEFSQDGTELRPISAWHAPGISEAPPTVNTIHLPWWRDQILSGKVSLLSRLEDLPEEASVEKEYFRQRGVLSGASIPLTVSREITGAMTFVYTTHQVSWTEDLVSQIKVIGDIFSNALKRKRTTDALFDAQNILCESEERFRLAMNNVAAGVCTTDLQGRVTYVNPAAEKMFGWSNAELLGKRMHDVTHYKRPDGTPFPASDCEGLQVLQNGIELREQDDMFIRKNGSFFPVIYSTSPLKRGTETVGLVVGFRDDTQRREAERATRQSEHELLEAQRLAHVGRWFWDAKNDIVTWSEELYRIAGRDPSSRAPSYKEHPQVYTSESWSRLSAAVEHALRSREPYELDLEMVRPDGTIRWITARGEAVCDAEDVTAGLRGTVQDITEYKQAEEVLSTMSQKLIQAQEHERASIGRELHEASLSVSQWQP